MSYKILLFFVVFALSAKAADWDINQRPLASQGPVGQCIMGDPSNPDEEKILFQRYDSNSKIFNMLRRNASNGDNISMCILGLTYLEGIKTEQDIAAGLSWLEKSSGSGYIPAKIHLYAIYRQGVLVPQDPERSLTYLDSTLDSPQNEGLCRLANEYTMGEILERDLPVAKELYERAYFNCDPDEVAYFRELTKNRAIIAIVFKLVLPTILVVVFVVIAWFFLIKQTGKLRK